MYEQYSSVNGSLKKERCNPIIKQSSRYRFQLFYKQQSFSIIINNNPWVFLSCLANCKAALTELLINRQGMAKNNSEMITESVSIYLMVVHSLLKICFNFFVFSIIFFFILNIFFYVIGLLKRQ